MPRLAIRLFGRFSAELDGRPVEALEGGRLQELLCYLVLNRARPHSREVLATLLWGDCPTAQSRKYLRQAFWQLQTALGLSDPDSSCRLLVIEGDWVRVNSEADCWFDVSEFEQSYQTAHGTAGRDLDGDRAAMLEKAVTLYRGELLEGCYDDWCLFERERLQNVYLIMLDKLMSYSEAVGDYEGGIDYGARILSCDRAREHAHRRLMRIYYLAGDRTAALRQYGRCAAALEEELAVKPSRRTSELFEQIRSDRLEGNVPPAASGQYQTASAAQISAALGRLRQVKTALVSFHRQIKQDIQALEVLVKEKRDS